jgi:hypothetical protein
MSEDYERIEGTGQIPSTGFGPGLTHLNESGIASRNENNALVESLKADKEAEQKNIIINPEWLLVVYESTP